MKNFIVAIIGIIVLIGIVVMKPNNNNPSADADEVLMAKNNADKTVKETILERSLAKDMMLNATGTVWEVIDGTDGADPGDQSVSSPQVLIILDEVSYEGEKGVRVMNTAGCIDKSIRASDKVVVEGKVVTVVPTAGIILACEEGAQIKRIAE